MPKKSQKMEEIIPVRADDATLANIQAAISDGVGADKSAAMRAAIAIVARLLTGDPHVYVVKPGDVIFGTRAGAEAYLESLGAQRVGTEFAIYDEDGDPETWYSVAEVLPR